MTIVKLIINVVVLLNVFYTTTLDAQTVSITCGLSHNNQDGLVYNAGLQQIFKLVKCEGTIWTIEGASCDSTSFNYGVRTLSTEIDILNNPLPAPIYVDVSAVFSYRTHSNANNARESLINVNKFDSHFRTWAGTGLNFHASSISAVATQNGIFIKNNSIYTIGGSSSVFLPQGVFEGWTPWCSIRPNFN